MSVVDDRLRELLAREQALRAREDELARTGGGGSGPGGGMDKRIDKVEGAIERIDKTLADLRVDAAVLNERVSHLPTQLWLFKAMAGLVTAIGVLTAVIVRFVPHVQ